MPIYSKPASTALCLLSHMAVDRKDIHTGRDLALATEISKPTAAKALRALSRDGIIKSSRGPGGGYRMAIPPKEVSLGRIASAIGGRGPFEDFACGFRDCSEEKPCHLHERWKLLKARLDDFFETNLHDIVIATKQRREMGGENKGIFSLSFWRNFADLNNLEEKRGKPMPEEMEILPPPEVLLSECCTVTAETEGVNISSSESVDVNPWPIPC